MLGAFRNISQKRSVHNRHYKRKERQLRVGIGKGGGRPILQTGHFLFFMGRIFLEVSQNPGPWVRFLFDRLCGRTPGRILAGSAKMKDAKRKGRRGDRHISAMWEGERKSLFLSQDIETEFIINQLQIEAEPAAIYSAWLGQDSFLLLKYRQLLLQHRDWRGHVIPDCLYPDEPGDSDEHIKRKHIVYINTDSTRVSRTQIYGVPSGIRTSAISAVKWSLTIP